MVLYLVRHGCPDYPKDILLPEGWEQAKLVSARFGVSGLDEIYASPQRRARQTAQPTAELLGLPVTVEPWAEELGRESDTHWSDGKQKALAAVPVADYMDLRYRSLEAEEALDKLDPIDGNGFAARYAFVSGGLDDFLKRLGYSRNDHGTYDPVAPNDRRVALFCHAAVMRVMLSHLWNVPFQYLASTLAGYYTGVTAIYFDRASERDISPALITYCDVGHLYAAGSPLTHHRDDIVF